MKHIAAVVAGLLLVFVGTSVTTAGTINVPGDQPTITAAISASSDGDIIAIAAGTYHEANLNTDGKAITICSASGNLDVTIDAQQNGSVLVIQSGEGDGTVIRNLVITGGSNNINGGGINCNNNSSPTITGCTISGNTTDYGGGIHCTSGSPTITGCTIRDNTANFNGGGITCGNSSNATITDCTISDNTANGGAYAQGGGGGGIYCNGSSPTITGCTILGNTAGGGTYALGGGIYCAASSPTITGCTISGNTSVGHGGGIDCIIDSNLTITGCTFTNNTPDTIHGDFTMVNTTGACCYDGLCFAISEDHCNSVGGTYADEPCSSDTACAATCDHDSDNDGDVDIEDLLTLLSTYGICQ